jgi:subtilase family serine protease
MLNFSKISSIILLLLISSSAIAMFDLSRNHGKLVVTSKGTIFIPDSSIPQVTDNQTGQRRMHTNYIVFMPTDNGAYETPSSIACIYGFVGTAAAPHCNPASTTELATGGWGTIAIVDAYDDRRAESDLNTFSTKFGLPNCTKSNGCFSQVYASGTQPKSCAITGDNWCTEIALDIEWAHAMAPNAKIMLVEAASDSSNYLFLAEQVASQLVDARGGGEISNSWGAAEYPSEINPYPDDPNGGIDNIFQKYTDIVYLVSTGDLGAPTSYPAASPYVIAVGGSSIQRDSSGNFVEEDAWAPSENAFFSYGGGSAGGPSAYENLPSYQHTISPFSLLEGKRATPDIALDADPQSGALVYDSMSGGWFIVGGTSLSSPAMAGVINVATAAATGTVAENTKIYGDFPNWTYWHKITAGYNYYNLLDSADSYLGYNLISGIGTPRTYHGLQPTSK